MSGVVGQRVPVGYQQTEVGVIPEDWNILSIDRAITEKVIIDQMDGNHGDLYPKSHEFSDSGVPYVGATDFDGGVIDYQGCKYLPLKRAALFKKGIAKDGDVLFAHNATVGPVAMVDTDLDYIILSTTATYYRCDNKKLINHYLKAYFQSQYFIDQYTAVMSQSTRNQVPILAQRKFFIVLPSEEEQTTIANALSDTDALITSLEKLINKKRAIKTAAMQQLLTGKTRLPGFDKDPNGETKGMKQTELGEIPEDWEVNNFSEIASPKSNRINPKNAGGGDLCIELEHVDQGSGTLNGSTLTTPGSSLKNIFYEGDILFGKLRSYLRKYWLADRSGVCSTEFWVFTANVGRAIPQFIFQAVQTDSFIDCTSESYGTHMPRSDWKVVKSFLVATPSINEQTAIANVLSDMEEEIFLIEQHATKIQQLKQGMMQELLTGRTRLI